MHHELRLSSEVFDASKNDFNVAFGLMTRHKPDIDDGSVAQLKAYLISWGEDSEGARYEKIDPIESQMCTTLQLGVSMQHETAHEIQSSFFEPANASPVDVKKIAQHLQCIDTRKVKLWGTHNSATGSRLVLSLERCSGTGCAEDVNLDEWVQDKQVFLYTNQKQHIVDREVGVKEFDHALVRRLSFSS